MMKNIIKYTGILAAVAMVGMMFTSCGDKLPKNEVLPYGTKLSGIRIINAGPNQDKVVEGTVDTTTMTISFPRISAKSNFGELRFEITASEGAVLDQETYDFSMSEEETDRAEIIKVMNHSRYTEWICKVGKIAPLKGADFDQKQIYRIEGAPAGDHRGSAFDGHYAYLVGSNNLKYISLDDLKAGKTEFKEMSREGVSGGWPSTVCVRATQGHAYVCNLAGGTASVLKIYYYKTPASTAECIFQASIGSMGGEGRHGDAFSMDLDEKGNGYMFFQGSNNNPGRDMLRLTVKNFKEVSDPIFLPLLLKGVYSFDTTTKLDGTDKYIHSGSACVPRIVDENMGVVYEFKNIAEIAEFNSVRIFTFNKQRYMFGTTVGRKLPSCQGVVYDIAKGKNEIEALDYFFAQEEIKPIYTQPVGGNAGGLAFAAADYYIEKDAAGKDSKLYLFSSGKNQGFSITEVPIKKLVEEE